MNLGDIIAEARILLLDTNATYERFSDADLLGFGNQTLRRMAVLRPDLFAYIGTVACTAGEVLQSCPSTSFRLMEVLQVVGGDAVRETNREIMDQNYPAWMSDTAGAAVNWMRHPRNQNKFFIYPKAPADQVLTVEYVLTPGGYAAGDEIDLLSDAYYPVVLDGIIFLAESMDNEHVNSGRASLFQKAFAEALSISLQGRSMTDFESGGMNEKEKLP